MLDFVRIVAAIFGSALLSAAFAQTQPDAREMVRKASERLIAAKQFEIAVTIQINTRRESDGTPEREKTISMHTAFADPDKYLIEWAGVDDANSGSDGVHAWAYWRDRNEYWTGSPDAAASELKTVKMTVAQFQYSESMTAKLLREDRIGTADCYVIEVHDVTTSPGGDLVWIDKQRLAILRQETSLTSGGITQSTTADYTTMKIDEPLRDSLFRFNPPPGAKQVDSLKR